MCLVLCFEVVEGGAANPPLCFLQMLAEMGGRLPGLVVVVF